MSAPTQARQPKGVPVGGQFATSSKAESATSLTDAEPVDEHRQALIERHLRNYAPDLAESEVARTVSEHLDAARAVSPEVTEAYVTELLAHQAALLDDNHDGPTGGWSAQDRAERIGRAHAAGMPADWPQTMAERGERWTTGCVDAWCDGLTADKLARLDSAGLAKHPTWARAYVGCDTDAVNEWHDAARTDAALSTYLATHLGHPGIAQYVADGVSLEDVRRAHELGLTPAAARNGILLEDGTQRTGPDALGEIARYMADSGLDQESALDKMYASIPAKLGKEYGSRFTGHEMRDLHAAGVPGKVARSLRATSHDLPAATVRRAHGHGIISGKDWKAWQSVVGLKSTKVSLGIGGTTGMYHEESIWRLREAGVTLADAQRLRSEGVPLPAIAPLVHAGVRDFAPWRAAAVPRTQGTANEAQRSMALRDLAAFANAGGTVEQFSRAQKAGIPMADLVAHVSSSPEQLWAAGAAHRARIVAEEESRFDRWGRYNQEPVRPWQYAQSDL